MRKPDYSHPPRERWSIGYGERRFLVGVGLLVGLLVWEGARWMLGW